MALIALLGAMMGCATAPKPEAGAKAAQKNGIIVESTIIPKVLAQESSTNGEPAKPAEPGTAESRASSLAAEVYRIGPEDTLHVDLAEDETVSC
jgi:hypothetical protein